MTDVVFRIKPAPVESARPRWLTAGTVRLLVLCACIVAVGMIRPRLTPHAARVVLVVGGVAVAAGVAAFLGAYLSSFVDWRPLPAPAEDREP